jgi:hypothetical protein
MLLSCVISRVTRSRSTQADDVPLRIQLHELATEERLLG